MMSKLEFSPQALQDFLLRKQPSGRLLPSAHAVDREFRVLKALVGTDVPVVVCGWPARTIASRNWPMTRV